LYDTTCTKPKSCVNLAFQEQYKLKKKVFGEMRSLTNKEFIDFYNTTGTPYRLKIFIL